MENFEYENKELCKTCGICCKKSGCDYWVSDFENLSFNHLYEKLMEGNISIVSTIIFEKLPNGKLYTNLFLYLRARNIDRPIVDLLSLKTTCSMLTDEGCTYDLKNRPSGGVNLIPKINGGCYHKVKPYDEMLKWESYQRVLEKLVKRISGYSVEERFRLDIIDLFANLMTENFDGVSEFEIADIFSMMPQLIESHYDEYLEAKEKVKITKKLELLNNKK